MNARNTRDHARQTAGGPADGASRAIDWDRLADEAVQFLSEYLRIDTTNPPGNEMAGARWLTQVLEREGFAVQVMDGERLGPGRANLYTRLRGNGSKRAIALVHHIDVVPANPAHWSVPPFSGTVKDGYVYGRGALDMKGEGIVHLVALIALKRAGVLLNRDIVFVANSDEELGSTGAAVFVDRHRDLLADVEYVITEGGDNPLTGGTLEYYGIGVAEKQTFWQRLRVKGVPSHGSRPTRDNPVPRLVRALERISRHETPVHVLPGVAKYFRDISARFDEPRRGWLGDVRAALDVPEAREWLLSDLYWNAILRNTISLTVLAGSNKTNTIPGEASAEIDIRLLPDQDPAALLRTLQALVDDAGVEWRTLLAPKPPLDNPVDTDLWRAIERAVAERDPGAIVTSLMLTGATDRPTYRKAGIITYGVDPFRIERAENQKGVHGNDERISIENIAFGIRYMYDILRYAQ